MEWINVNKLVGDAYKLNHWDIVTFINEAVCRSVEYRWHVSSPRVGRSAIHVRSALPAALSETRWINLQQGVDPWSESEWKEVEWVLMKISTSKLRLQSVRLHRCRCSLSLSSVASWAAAPAATCWRWTAAAVFAATSRRRSASAAATTRWRWTAAAATWSTTLSKKEMIVPIILSVSLCCIVLIRSDLIWSVLIWFDIIGFVVLHRTDLIWSNMCNVMVIRLATPTE